MMEHEITATAGARKKRKRLGRGDSSGHGSYSGRGMKGQKSRSGKGLKPGFEGGQLPLIKGLPMMRGFTNIFKDKFHIVKIGDLGKLTDGTEVNPQTLVETGLLRKLKYPVKVLGNGELSVSLSVFAHKFTKTSEKKILAAGGRVELI